MKVTIEFDSDNPEEMDAVLAVLSASPVGKDPSHDRAGSAEKAKADEEAAAAKKAKAKDEAAAKAKADEEVAAAKKAKAKDEEVAKAKADEEAAAKAKADEEVDDGLGPVGDDAPELTLEDVRLALQGYAAIEGRPAAIAILNRHGAKSISELSPDKFRAAYDEAKLRK